MRFSPLAAHGLEGSAELPVPMLYALVGASWALTLTFVVAAVAWRSPKFIGGPAPQPPRRAWLGVIGAALTAVWLMWLFTGPDDHENRGMAALYVLLWVGIVPLALLAGHVWRDLSPWRSVQAVVGRAVGKPNGWLDYPSGWGYWPAAAGLLAFGWLELASPDPSSVMAVRVWVLGYMLVTVVGGLVFGPRWFDRADPFDVYSAVVAHGSPLVRDGRWQLHNPLRSLAAIPVDRGLVAVVAVLLGSTAFDSFSGTSAWTNAGHSRVEITFALAGFSAAAALLFSLAAMATGGVEDRRALPSIYVHSLVPIAIGYVLAHYLTAFLGQGPEILGLPDAEDYVAGHAGVLAVVKVSLVVVGHLLAILAAHDCALRVLPRAHRLSGQLAMLLLMVGYTFTGLYLLLTT